MPVSLDLNLYLSGGAVNSDPQASLGGAKSSTEVLSQTAGSPTNVTGVMINYAAGNAAGDGTLAYTDSSTSLTWAGAGAGAGDPVDVSSNGDYLVEDDSGGYIEVTVTAGSLPGSDQSDTDITIAFDAENLWDDIDKLESFSGHTDYRCIYVQNDGAETIFSAKSWIAAQAGGDATFELGVDPAGKNSTGTSIGSETSAPAGVSFSAADGEGSALSLGVDLGAGDYIALWIKRIVPASSTGNVATDVAVLAAGGLK